LLLVATVFPRLSNGSVAVGGAVRAGAVGVVDAVGVFFFLAKSSHVSQWIYAFVPASGIRLMSWLALQQRASLSSVVVHVQMCGCRVLSFVAAAA
jgi:hypothetical protein